MATLIARRLQYLSGRYRQICCTSRNFICASILQQRLDQEGFDSGSTKSTLEEIVIPKRIKRGPTEILEALSSTVSRDYTAAHYKFEDDPFLIPVSNAAKRSYALSKEAGRKAAKWIRDTYPNYIVEGDAEPKIPLFSPKEIYTKDSDVSVETLVTCIEAIDVLNAITVYDNLQSKSVEIDPDTRQQLLELLCFYNCENAPDKEFMEENWFRGMSSKSIRKTWRGAGLVDKLFNETNPKTSCAYAAMIQGLGKSERAWLLFKEMQDNGLAVDVDTYNTIIRQVCYMRETSDARWKLTMSLLSDMNQAGLKPNLSTMNAVLENISRMGSWKDAKKLALQVLAEMNRLRIEPSLASYYFVLMIFCRERGPISTILYDIMEHLNGKEFTIRDPKDVSFFLTAMDISHAHLQDKELAYQVDALLHTGKNRLFIGDSLKEAIYYQHFFKLLSETENVDTFFEHYNKLVPNIYTPEPSVMLKILHMVEDSYSVQYLPHLWSDMVSFEHYLRENLLEAMLQAMVTGEPEEELLRARFAAIVLHMRELVDSQRSVGAPLQVIWSGQMLANMIIILLRGGKYDNACDVLDKCHKEHHRILGPLTINALEMFLKTAIEREHTSKAISCTQYMAGAGYIQAVEYAHQIINKMNLNEIERSKLSDILTLKIADNISDET